MIFLIELLIARLFLSSVRSPVNGLGVKSKDMSTNVLFLLERVIDIKNRGGVPLFIS
jgi:hypothetical protein